MLKLKTISIVLGISLLFIAACEKMEDEAGSYDYGNGVYIVNEGAYGQNNGSISYYDIDFDTVINNVFEKANNNRPVGDVVQSLGIASGYTGYLVVNGSSKIEIVDIRTFTVTNSPIIINYPRYFIQVNENKGYVTAGSMQGWVYNIDLQSNVITDSTMVGYGPEMLLSYQGKVYVANSGGWGIDSTISVINSSTDAVVDTIIVGDTPLDMVFDSDDNLWVICKGYAQYDWNPPYDLIHETDALLMKVNPLSGEVVWQETIGKGGDFVYTYPKIASTSDGTVIYLLMPSGIYELNAASPSIPVDPLIAGSYYGLEVNPDDDHIFVFESSFTGAGKMRIYESDGTLLKEKVVGIGPNGAAFNID